MTSLPCPTDECSGQITFQVLPEHIDDADRSYLVGYTAWYEHQTCGCGFPLDVWRALQTAACEEARE